MNFNTVIQPIKTSTRTLLEFRAHGFP